MDASERLTQLVLILFGFLSDALLIAAGIVWLARQAPDPTLTALTLLSLAALILALAADRVVRSTPGIPPELPKNGPRGQNDPSGGVPDATISSAPKNRGQRTSDG